MSSKNIDFYSYGSTIDGTNYCSGVETLAENVIEDNEADSVIVYPSSNGWARLRSESYRMTDENSAAVLPLPIYKVNKVLLRPAVESFTLTLGGNAVTISIYDFVNADGKKFELDISELVLPVEEWQALPIAQNGQEYEANICKDNTFYWEKGATSIAFLGTVYKNGVIFADNSPTYKRLISYMRYKIVYGNYTYTYNGQTIPLENLITQYNFLPSTSDVRDWQYRIEYVPLTSAFKIKSRKRAHTNIDYMQPFNQRAEVNAASAFGKNMYLTAQKTGVRELTVVKNYTRLADIPPLGALVIHKGKKYRLIANTYKQTNTIYVQVTHTLSENWTSKSKHVSVNQKYRNWNIPQDMLWRNLYWEDYLCIAKEQINTLHNNDTAGISIDDFMQGLKVSKTNDKTVDTFAWDNVVLPCSTMGIGNSLVFSASMKDQLSAGLREIEPNLCEEVLYCNADGTLNRANVKLSAGIGNGIYTNGVFIEKKIDDNFDLIGRRNLPLSLQGSYNGAAGYAWNMPLKVVFNKSFLIDKTAGEAIKFTYQIHLTPYDSDIVVGNAFAELNPLIKKWESDRKFKVWLMKDYLREGEDLIISGNNTAYTQTYDGQYFTLESNGGYITLRLNISVDFQSSGYVGWCITDENNKLYLGCNSATTVLYLTMQHKRK